MSSTWESAARFAALPLESQREIMLDQVESRYRNQGSHRFPLDPAHADIDAMCRHYAETGEYHEYAMESRPVVQLRRPRTREVVDVAVEITHPFRQRVRLIWGSTGPAYHYAGIELVPDLQDGETIEEWTHTHVIAEDRWGVLTGGPRDIDFMPLLDCIYLQPTMYGPREGSSDITQQEIDAKETGRLLDVRERIKWLDEDARRDGDEDLQVLCNRALAGDSDAFTECERLILTAAD